MEAGQIEPGAQLEEYMNRVTPGTGRPRGRTRRPVPRPCHVLYRRQLTVAAVR